MRILFLLIFAIGAGMGFVYPWAIQSFSGKEVGTWQVFDPVKGFSPVQANLDDTDDPVRVLIDLTSMGAPAASGSRTVLTLTVSTDGKTVLAETLTFINAIARDDAPQTVQQVYREDVGVLPKIEDGVYTFTIGPGDAEDFEIKAVHLVLRAGAGPVDNRALPVGLSLMAVGIIGLILSFRRRNPGNPNSQPPAPKWGRGAG